MKTLRVIAITLLAISIVFFSGCKDENSIEKGETGSIQPVFKLALSEFNANKLPHETGMLLNGEVSITRNDNNEIIIFIKERNNQTSKIFFLQLQKGEGVFSDQAIENASILYLRRMLIVHSNTSSKNYLFTLADQSYLENAHLKNLKFKEEYSGYGLGMKEVEVDDVGSRSDCSCKCYSSFEIERECQSGGAGSSSCSQGDCSVTCQSTYYACCNC